MVPSCRGGLQKRPNHTVNNQIRPHRTETSPEDYGLGTRPDHGFCCLLSSIIRPIFTNIFFVGTKITEELYFDVQVQNIKDPTKIGHTVDAI